MSTEETNDITVNPLSGSFGTLGDISNAVSYAHEESDPILRSAKEILEKIPAGERLLEVLKQYNIPINTVKGRELTYNNPDDQSLFLVLPPFAEKHPELIALTLGCGIRDVEQGIVGFTRPDKETDPVEFASVTFSKSLDILVNMCQIADELKEKLGFTKPLDIIDELGHSNLYKAYKSEADHDALVDIFVDGVNATEGN